MFLNDALKERVSVRRFEKNAVNTSLIALLVEAGAEAPSSCNKQAVRVKRVSNAAAFKLASQAPVLNAPCVLAVYCLPLYNKGEENTIPFIDAGLFTENVLLKATELLLGSCVIAPAFNQTKARNALNLPEGALLACFILIGTPAEAPLKPTRLKARELLNAKTRAPTKKSKPRDERFFWKQAIAAWLFPFLAIKWIMQRERIERETGVWESLGSKFDALIEREWWR